MATITVEVNETAWLMYCSALSLLDDARKKGRDDENIQRVTNDQARQVCESIWIENPKQRVQ
jgi:hypothetical protein